MSEKTEVAVTIKTDPAEAMALQTGFSKEDIATMKNTVFTELKTESQFKMALIIAKKYDLDPFAKEIWGWVDNKGKLMIITSASGIAKIIRRQEGFKRLVSQAVYPEDEFEMDLATNELLKHKIGARKSTSKPLGAYAIVEIGNEKIIQWVDWHEYAPGNENAWSPWSKQKSAMIQKCAITVLGRQSIGLSGIYGEEEMEASQPRQIPEATAQIEEGVIETETELEKFEMEIVGCRTIKELQALAPKVKQFPASLKTYSTHLTFLNTAENETASDITE